MRNKTVYKICFLAFLISFSLNQKAQKAIDPDKIVAFNVTVNFDDHTVKTQMLKNPKKVRVRNDISYLWFYSNKIMETKGGYDGKLLHGYYKSFYLNNQLRESGEIEYGIKNNEWRYWYSDGKLKEIITWKKGRKSGKYEIYNDYGQLMAKGCFKNDLLHGKFYTYNNQGKIIDVKKYRYGIEKIPKPKKEKPVKRTKVKDSTVEKQKKKKEKVKFGDKVKKLFVRKGKSKKEKKEE